jgi:hypothetical protein
MDTLYIKNDVSEKDEEYWKTLESLCLIVMKQGIDTVIEDLDTVVHNNENFQELRERD